MATTKKKLAVKKTIKKPKSAVTRRSSKKTEPRSFQIVSDDTPFFTFKLTTQSFYWFVLSVAVLAIGAWVMYINAKVQDIYDQIEINTVNLETLSEKPVKKSR